MISRFENYKNENDIHFDNTVLELYEEGKLNGIVKSYRADFGNDLIIRDHDSEYSMFFNSKIYYNNNNFNSIAHLCFYYIYRLCFSIEEKESFEISKKENQFNEFEKQLDLFRKNTLKNNVSSSISTYYVQDENVDKLEFLTSFSNIKVIYNTYYDLDFAYHLKEFHDKIIQISERMNDLIFSCSLLNKNVPILSKEDFFFITDLSHVYKNISQSLDLHVIAPDNFQITSLKSDKSFSSQMWKYYSLLNKCFITLGIDRGIESAISDSRDIMEKRLQSIELNYSQNIYENCIITAFLEILSKVKAVYKKIDENYLLFVYSFLSNNHNATINSVERNKLNISGDFLKKIEKIVPEDMVFNVSVLISNLCYHKEDVITRAILYI